MAPIFESPPSSNYNNKSQNGITFSGFLPPQEMTQQQNDNNALPMHYYESFFPFANNFGDLDDFVVPEIANIGASLNYYSTSLTSSFGTSEGDNTCHIANDCAYNHGVYTREPSGISDVLLSALPEACNAYSYSSPSFVGVGCYQLCDNGDQEHEGNLCRTFGNYVHANNNFAPITPESLGHINTPISGENNVKVQRYSIEERRDRILRYLKKKNQRNFNKTIKYTCRKTLADRRVRIRGRFAKNNEEESLTNNNFVTLHEKSLAPSYYDKSEQYYDEEWVQEAMSSWMYEPYISG